ALYGELSACATELGAAILDVRLGHGELVNLDETGVDSVNELETGSQTFRPEHRCEAEIAVVRLGEDTVEIAPACDCGYWTKDLVAAHRRARGDPLDQGRGVKLASAKRRISGALAAYQNSRAARLAGHCHVTLDTVELLARNDGAD